MGTPIKQKTEFKPYTLSYMHQMSFQNKDLQTNNM